MIRRAVAAPAALLLALLPAGCAAGSADDGGSPSPPPDVASVSTDLRPCPEESGEPAAGNAPQVSLECFTGGTLDLSRAPGVPTVLNLWASWCGPCREELPVVQQLADAAGDRLRVVGVASKDGVPQASSFVADARVTFPSAYDGDGAAMTALGLAGLPYTLFLTADGTSAHVEVGQVESVPEFEQLVAEHLGVQL